LRVQLRPWGPGLDLEALFQHSLKESFCMRFSYRGAQDLFMNLTGEDYKRMFREALEGDPDFLQGERSFALISSIKKNQKQAERLALRVHVGSLSQYRQIALPLN
jgi:hypothetical protein